MFACRFGHRQTRGNHPSPRLLCLTLVCAFMLLDPRAVPIQYAQAGHLPAHAPNWTDFNTHDSGIVLASGASTQAVVLLISNAAGQGEKP